MQRQPASGPTESRRLCGWRNVPAFCLIILVQCYRSFISPLFPPACRFVPTCSQYAIEAIRRHGAVKGSWLTLWRLLRCHPFSRGGYDPVK